MNVGRGRVTMLGGRGEEGEPARWLAGEASDALTATAAEAVRGLSPAVLPRAITTAEGARLGLRVQHLGARGQLPGRGSWPLKAGLMVAVAGVGAVGALGVVHWRAREQPREATSEQRGEPTGTELTAWAMRSHSTPGTGPALVPASAGLASAGLASAGLASAGPASTGPASTGLSSTGPSEGSAPPASGAVKDKTAARGETVPTGILARGGSRHVRAALAASSSRQGGAAEEDALNVETRLLDQARELLATQPARSLAVLAEHRRRFPHGQLEAEREFMSIQALVRLGLTAEARRRAHALEVAHPQSSYVGRAARLLDVR